MKQLNGVYSFFGNVLIKGIIIVGLVFVPLVSLVFTLRYPYISHGWLFLLFICVLAIERVWETFYSTEDRKKHKLQGDWTLPLVSIAYIIMLFGVTWEFFTVRKELNYSITYLALFIFIVSFLLRVYSMKTLKEQWSVHAVGAKKVKNVFLVKTGPYKYVRHPIYLGVILEVLSIPLIWNAYFIVIFTSTVNVPLQLMRAYFEEKATVRKLGQDYVLYKSVVPAFLPFKFLTKEK